MLLFAAVALQSYRPARRRYPDSPPGVEWQLRALEVKARGPHSNCMPSADRWPRRQHLGIKVSLYPARILGASANSFKDTSRLGTG